MAGRPHRGASDESQRTYRTSDVAREVGVHPNTVRSYEAQGFLPPVPRAPNGYRLFRREHIEQMRLAWMAMQFTWIGGDLRRAALSIIEAGALILALALIAFARPDVRQIESTLPDVIES